MGGMIYITSTQGRGPWWNLVVTGQSVRWSLISLITLPGLINHSDHSDNSSFSSWSDLIVDHVLAKHGSEAASGRKYKHRVLS